VLGSLIVFGVGVLLIGNRQYLFSRTYHLQAKFDTVAGLDDGAVVRSGGVRIGIVQHIRMPRRSGDKVTVEMRLKKSSQEVIKQDSVAAIETEGLLGSKYVSISFGSPESAPVKDGDKIASRPPFEYSALAQQASDIMESTKKALAKIDRGEGALGALLGNKKVSEDLSASVATLREDLDALKHNPLLRGYFKRRGYSNASDLTAHEIASLPQRSALRTFAVEAGEIFKKPDTAKLRNTKALDRVGEFLEATPFGLVVVTAYSGQEGEKEKNLELTQARAAVVREYLVKKFKIDDARIKTKGMGEGTAQTDSSKAGRVEILVYPERQ
jgi:phospholipid/cholesterol/gamma-HCH transport system substrate-binding protein